MRNGAVRQQPPGDNRIEMLYAQLRACSSPEAYREGVRGAAARARASVPIVDLVHRTPAYNLTTLIGLLERERFQAPVLLFERGLDAQGTPFVHHECATAALGAACTALFSLPDCSGSPTAHRQLLADLVGLWLIAAVATAGGTEDQVLRDLARGMGPWMVPQGWAGRLLQVDSGEAFHPHGMVVALVREAVAERAPGLKLRVVRQALEALDVCSGAQYPQLWRRALAFVVGADLHQDPLGRLHAEYHAHRESPASRHRRAVDFIYREAIPTYHSVRD
ncbi:hypothetical protein [Halorhodospira abdelmalekii]|uniref:hypothetical protein n=1 Tax=Halorhodospira abdelmalekii TaxID=421629 RepID=UPI00190892BE|nr:hypothetical protein [Halorhodospira abdelmalekii]